jgi:hypothetical protein
MASEDKNAIIQPCKEVEILLLELKVLVNELNADVITEEEYARRREIILERLIEVC